MAPPALDDCSRALLDAEADCDSASESLYEKSPWHRTLHKPQGFSFAFVLKLATTLFLIAATMALLIIQAAGRIASGRIHTSCGLPTDILFGEIAYQTRTLNADDRFMTADPSDIDNDNRSSIWSEIYPSAWVAVPDPSIVGFGGGAKLSEHSENPSEWDTKTEAFGVAVMHQVHCVALIKRSLLVYRLANGKAETVNTEHLDHCVEYLRQAVLCHGDLTLERPESMVYPHRTTGWGNNHRCRDWDQLISSLRGAAIERGPNGWRRPS